MAMVAENSSMMVNTILPPPGLEEYASYFSNIDRQAASRKQQRNKIQAKNSNVIFLSDQLDSNSKKQDSKKSPHREPLPAPGSAVDSEKGRSQRFAPKKKDLVLQYSQHAGPVVTLMICNIPCRITQQQLMDVVNRFGFEGRYDFLYLPTGGRSSTVGSSNLGYAFINFMNPADTDPFTHAFQNYQFEGTSSTKVCSVRPAHIQGLENNIIHFDRTAARGRPRREGPFIRTPEQTKKADPEPKTLAAPFSLPEAAYVETSAYMDPTTQDFNSCAWKELSWLQPLYFDFLDDGSDLIVGCA